jgi:hypothetical protein
MSMPLLPVSARCCWTLCSSERTVLPSSARRTSSHSAAPGALGLGLELALQVLVDEPVGDERRLGRIGRGETDADQARLFLGRDREPLEEPLEQRGGFAAVADFEKASVRLCLAPSPLGCQRVGATGAGPCAGEESLEAVQGFGDRVGYDLRPDAAARRRGARCAGGRVTAEPRVLGEFGIAVELEIADHPGRQAARLENRHLGVDLRAIADEIVHPFVDPHDARRTSLDDDQDLGVVVRCGVREPNHRRAHAGAHGRKQDPLPPADRPKEAAQIDLAGVGHRRHAGGSDLAEPHVADVPAASNGNVPVHFRSFPASRAARSSPRRNLRVRLGDGYGRPVISSRWAMPLLRAHSAAWVRLPAAIFFIRLFKCTFTVPSEILSARAMCLLL